MYIPELYKNEDETSLENFIHENGFGIIVNQTFGKLWATHIPFILEKKDGINILTGHISKLNPQSDFLKNGDEVLVIFHGAHAYISSSWYDHENVPTWNYLAVHVYGTVKLHSYEEGLEGLKKLMDKHEKNQENPISLENLSEKTLSEARGITSFEIKVTMMHGVKKLSQNRDDYNYKNIIEKLENSEDENSKEIAKAMKKNRK